jgi:hypothetical protein
MLSKERRVYLLKTLATRGGSQSMLSKRDRVGLKWSGRVAPKTEIVWVQGGVAAMAPKTEIMSVRPRPKKEGRNSLSEGFSGEGLGGQSMLSKRKRVPGQEPLGRLQPIGTEHMETPTGAPASRESSAGEGSGVSRC